jgi:hypothetical protein
MGSFNISLPRTERPISESLTSVPRQFRELAKRGFKVLAGVGKQHYAEILRAVVITLESREPPFVELEKSLGISKDDLGALMAAAMIAVPLLGNNGTAEEFTTAATKVEILAPDLVAEILPFFHVVIQERPLLARAIRRASLPDQVLPSFSDVDIVIDVRIAFEEHAVYETVPVAIIHIDTDADGREIWFQASKAQMERLKSSIGTAIERMESAAAWAQKKELPS